ncbi:MAG: hypothetical protein FWE75_09235 [Actinomycetia bacterium]|nr:hypothetical protein [Actinomycetes bacterium]
MTWDIEFDAGCGIDDADSRDEIRSALVTVAAATTESGAPAPGRWPSTVRTVRVCRRLAGGRSGSEVLEIAVVHAGGDEALQVAKLSDRASATKEWAAFRRIDRSNRFAMYVPILAVSRAVLEPERHDSLGRQVVVYQHAGDRDQSGGEVRSLEDVVVAGIRGHTDSQAASDAVSAVTRALARALHRAPDTVSGSLRARNRDLGSDLTLDFDIVRDGDDEGPQLMMGNPSGDEVLAAFLPGDALLRNSTAPPGEQRTLSVRDLVAVRLEDVELTEHGLTGRVEDTRVKVTARGRAKETDLESALAGQSSVEVYGSVAASRADTWSRRLRTFLDADAAGTANPPAAGTANPPAAGTASPPAGGGATGLPGYRETPTHLECAGVAVAHPLRSLHQVLTGPPETRVHSMVHGDLNPRNILLCGLNPYLIDYAQADTSGATLADYAWLEVCALRELTAEDLPWSELVQLQRDLAVLTALAPVVAGKCQKDLLTALVASAQDRSPVLARCLTYLWTVRAAALEVAEAVGPEAAPRHLFQHLTLAACRSLKFPDEDQSTHKVAVSAATAGVASEALQGLDEAFFAQWPPQQVAALTGVLLRAPRLEWAAAEVLLAAWQACRAQQAAGGPTAAEVLGSLFGGPLAATLDRRRAECARPDPYIPLTGRVLTAGEPLVQRGDGALVISPDHAVDILMRHHRVVLVGDPGAGKTVVARELQARLLREGAGGRPYAPHEATGAAPADGPEGSGAGGGAGPGSGTGGSLGGNALVGLGALAGASGPGGPGAAHGGGPCWPVTASALRIIEQLRDSGARTATAPGVRRSAVDVLRACCAVPDSVPTAALHRLLRMGGLHVVVDELNRLDATEKPVVVRWIRALGEDYPELPIVVCQRSWEFRPENLPWPAVVLHEVRKQQARDYIEDTLRTREPQSWRGRVAALEKQLFDDPDAAALRDMAGKPLFLRMLVQQYGERHHGDDPQISANPGALVHLYLARLQLGVDENEAERRMQLLQLLAHKMGDHGSAIRYQDALQTLQKMQPKDTESTLQALLNMGPLQTDPSQSWVTFRDPLVHAYFAAAALQAEAERDLVSVTERVMRFDWRDAAQMLVADPDADKRLVSAVLDAAVRANAVYGAWLLQATPPDSYPGLRDRLLTGVQETLTSADSGGPAWRQAAYALAKYGTPQAMQILHDVAVRGDAAPAAADALDGLVMMHQWFAPGAGETLREALRTLLETPADALSDELTVRALRSVAATEQQALSGYVWSRLQPGASWPVVRQAWQTLEELGVLPSGAMRTVYAEACARQLAQVDADLLACADTATAGRLNRERMDLLGVLAGEGRLAELLDHRFRMGLADQPGWEDYLRGAAELVLRDAPQDELAHCVVEVDEKAQAGWLELLCGADEARATAAAHRLLMQGTVVAGTVLEELGTALGEAGSPARLMAVAAFVHGLGAEDVPAVERIVEGIVARLGERPDPEVLEPLAALVAALGRHDLAPRPRLALAVDRSVREHGLPQARFWPWAATWREAMPDRTDTGLLLADPDLDDNDVLTLISTTDVLLDAPPFQPLALDFEQRERLLALRPGDPTGLAAHRYVLLAASAGLYESLGFVHEVAQHVANNTRTITHSHPVHGLVEVSMAAHAVSALGLLAKLALSDGAVLSVRAQIGTLMGMAGTAQGRHPSLERARLVGLGFLGDWEELLDSLPPDDPVMHQAARNITSHWLPGPLTQTGDSHLEDVARWIGTTLRTQTLPASTRTVLAQIRDSAESAMRRYVP